MKSLKSRLSFPVRKYFSLLFLLPLRLAAQCAMCTSTVELTSERNHQVGSAFNRSIGFMLLIPTLLVIGVGLLLFLRLHRAAAEHHAGT